MSESTNAAPNAAPGSNSPATQATAAASNVAAAAVVGILLWLLTLVKINVPSEVSADFAVLVGMGVHWAVLKYGIKS